MEGHGKSFLDTRLTSGVGWWGGGYGLCASVWSQSVGTIHRVAHQLEVGTVWSNCWLSRFNSIIKKTCTKLFPRSLDMPFGGVKDSGTGREGTRHSLELLTEEKTHRVKIN